MTMNKIKICECRTEDIDDSVKGLWLSLAREMFEIEHFVMPSDANGAKWVKFVREGLANGKSFVLVALYKGEPVGFAHATFFRDYPLEVSELVGIVNDLYVLPEVRRKCIGKKLMVECMNKMKAKGVNKVRLSVHTENEAAIKLYEKLGFKICSYTMMKS